MRSNLLLAAALLCSLSAFAQNATYKYELNGNLLEQAGTGPAMTAYCPGTYAAEALPVGITRKTYRFNTGCGLLYNDATKNFITSGSYTIELYFRLDTISGYKKLVDFDSLKADAGVYNQNGMLALYPNVTSADSFIGAGVYQYVAITRDATTKKVYLNANGKTKGTYIDAGNVYKPGTSKLISFFRDDNSTSGEQSKGAVALIRISNYAMDSNSVKAAYAGLSAALGVPSAGGGEETAVYPNPASGILHIKAASDGSYTICDITGRSLTSGKLQRGENTLSIDGLPGGLYLIRMTASNGRSLGIQRFSCVR